MIQIREYDGFLVDNEFNIYNERTGRKITPYIGSDGYMGVSRKDENNRCHHNRLHVILAHCFIPNPSNLKYVNHKDSNKLNNELSNLEWCTNSYNVQHGWDSGNRIHHNNTKVIAHSLAGEFIGQYDSIRKCAKSLYLDRHKVARVLKGELREDYLGYLFDYVEGPTTTESIA